MEPHIAVEMMIEPGAEKLIVQMGRKMRTKARSKVLNRVLTHLRDTEHNADIAAWFSEERFLAQRRTTVRISSDNAAYVKTLAQVTGRGRPSILLDIVYLAASKMQQEDFEAMRS